VPTAGSADPTEQVLEVADLESWRRTLGGWLAGRATRHLNRTDPVYAAGSRRGGAVQRDGIVPTGGRARKLPTVGKLSGREWPITCLSGESLNSHAVAKRLWSHSHVEEGVSVLASVELPFPARRCSHPPGLRRRPGL
jgi:hypothetical protein